MRTLDIPADTPQPVRPCGELPATTHLFEPEAIDAINAALAARRPLLVRGLPGVGKSQLARAAASALKRAFVSKVVDAQTRIDDLLWHFDTVERLAMAQLEGALGGDRAEAHCKLKVGNFLSPGPLWWTFDWASADDQAKRVGARRLEGPSKWKVAQGCVLLIDEIDKADSSVPNGLLECLGNGVFHAPGGLAVSRDLKAEPPLVIVTTNEERALPDAFLRRCLVLHLALPEDDDALVELLCKRGRAHHPESELPEKTLKQAARLLGEDRTKALGRHLCPPGQAEYLDLCRALATLAPGDGDEQAKILVRLRKFVFDKHPTEARRQR